MNKKITIFGLGLEVRDTKKYGRGVFSTEGIKKGEVIKVLSGEVISLSECWERINAGNEANDDPLQIGSELYMDLDFLSHAFNHNCNPNAGIMNESELFALRDIRTGEEITYDYSTTVGPNIPSSEWSMRCECGASNCRGTIGNILTIPKKYLENYKKSGALQCYMKSEFGKILK